MPTYQYVCTDCDAPLEVVQSFSDDALTDCPACEGGRLRKVYGSVGVVFKGSGFYRTDSRGSSGGGESTGAKDSGSKDSGSKDSGSKDSGTKDSGSGGAPGNPSTGATSAAGHSVTPAAATSS